MSEKPAVEMVGEDGNAMAILGRCGKAMRKAGWDADKRRAFMDEATECDYDHLLATVQNCFNCDGLED